MRVTHVITRLIVGGAQENTISSVLGFHEKPGVEVDLISGPTFGPEGSMEAAFSRNPSRKSLPSYKESQPTLTVVPSLVRPVHPWKDLRCLFDLTAIFRANRPDIVHTHSGKAGVIGRLAAHRAGVPIVFHTIHGPSFGSFQGSLANFIFSNAERIAARVTTHFISVADAMTRQHLESGIGRPEQFTRVFSGFNLKPFLQAQNDPAIRHKLGLKPDDFVVGMVARLCELKGHNDFFDIAPKLIKHCPQIRFLFVGDGPWRPRFEQRARTMGLSAHFIFTGLVRPREVSTYMGVMDMLAHLSRREGLPRALPQALAAGKPVVAYDCDGAREVCFSNETGFLIPVGDQVELTRRILQLAGDPALRSELGERGRDLVQENFPVERMIEEIHQLYLRFSGRQGKKTA